ncbi:hypothetical protein IH922_10110 [candidate division KSB1 bacterium]|nr:hypothetical protein [candidate division KSB1 bacterium]
MKLHFDPNQQFQHDAINSIVGIFEGQPLNQGDFSFSISSPKYLFQDGGVGNRLEISEEQILKNIQEIQKKNELPLSKKLDGMNFSVEMETGTGKTYGTTRDLQHSPRIPLPRGHPRLAGLRLPPGQPRVLAGSIGVGARHPPLLLLPARTG